MYSATTAAALQTVTQYEIHSQCEMLYNITRFFPVFNGLKWVFDLFINM